MVRLVVHAPEGDDRVFHAQTRPLNPCTALDLTPRWWAAFAKTAALQVEYALRQGPAAFLPTVRGYPAVMVRPAAIRRGAFAPLDAGRDYTVHEFFVVPNDPTGTETGSSARPSVIDQ